MNKLPSALLLLSLVITKGVSLFKKCTQLLGNVTGVGFVFYTRTTNSLRVEDYIIPV